jgi:hypothetical protein
MVFFTHLRVVHKIVIALPLKLPLSHHFVGPRDELELDVGNFFFWVFVGMPFSR